MLCIGWTFYEFIKFVKEYNDLPDDRQIVLVCRGGRRSTRAAYMMRQAGKENVVVLQGGMLDWGNADLLSAV